MLKILKNLRKSLISVIIIVILLCIQAMADLALPDYTSKVVNTGIQARRNRKFYTRGNKERINEQSSYIYIK